MVLVWKFSQVILLKKVLPLFGMLGLLFKIPQVVNLHVLQLQNVKEYAVSELLKSQDIDVNAVDDMGRTALQYNAFDEIGSGDSSEERPRTTSFSVKM